MTVEDCSCRFRALLAAFPALDSARVCEQSYWTCAEAVFLGRAGNGKAVP